MEFRYAISVVLEAHHPFVPRLYPPFDLIPNSDASAASCIPVAAGTIAASKDFSPSSAISSDRAFTAEELNFFESVSETFLPLLEMLERLEHDHVFFRLALVLTPVLCQMLRDEIMQYKYINYIDRQIEFGKQEIERNKNKSELKKAAENYFKKLIGRKKAYTEKYEKNLLKEFDFYKRMGKLEIISSCATSVFLPFIADNPESIQAQMETPASIYKKNFGESVSGFWLPYFGWTPLIEPFLLSGNYSYTIVNTHGLLFGNPAPEKGSFYPVKTHKGSFILARDYYSSQEIGRISSAEIYRNNNLDAGYELPPEKVKMFLSSEGQRRATGFKYMAKKPGTVYNSKAAMQQLQVHAKIFLEKTSTRLQEASKYMQEPPLCLIADNADKFGHQWHEGFLFLETLFRMAADFKDLSFINPGEFIFKQDLSSLQTVEPEISSSGKNGYAESFITSSNDYLFRHLFHAMNRMTELAEMFPDETGIKERALNQAAREILLAQSFDKLSSSFMNQTEDALRSFTTIYEYLGSNYISTDWLTKTERRHNLFPNINYRVFRKKSFGNRE